MISRRKFIYTSSLLSLGLSMNINAKTTKSENTFEFYMPEESQKHKQTWMSFVANDYIWSKRQIAEVKRNLSLIAKTIAKYEPVSVLVSPYDKNKAIKLLDVLNSHNYPITLVEKEIDDLWLRDTGPTFVYNNKNEKLGVDFNFNGWGEDQEHELDSTVASFITKTTNTKTIKTDLVLEGGCFEIDGEGLAIMSESCILNDNRNPNKSKQEVEEELKYLLGLEKIIWLKGIKGKDITDGHTDFYARFISSDEIIVAYEPDEDSYEHELTKENISILEKATNLKGENFKITLLENPQEVNEKYGIEDFAAGYIGYYLCNDAVIMQGFGDDYADKKAKDTLQKAYPNRIIEQIRIDGIASGGGSIHCATQQEPIDLL
ncbi:agmatine deiminase family protein [Poseidonibacter lekithochrous]|uniref:agmatine deiminase family protein n=1 Tax=Poseidonibacter lekithochrous TaxID=1904463 RepID=UPI000D38764D|nr:agmatine deiminase family protein [Poseidonibacter lekithochrous]